MELSSRSLCPNGNVYTCDLIHTNKVCCGCSLCQWFVQFVNPQICKLCLCFMLLPNLPDIQIYCQPFWKSLCFESSCVRDVTYRPATERNWGPKVLLRRRRRWFWQGWLVRCVKPSASLKFIAEGKGAGNRADYYDLQDQRFLGDRNFVEQIDKQLRAERAQLRGSGLAITHSFFAPPIV
jgi:hypothetical protein